MSKQLNRHFSQRTYIWQIITWVEFECASNKWCSHGTLGYLYKIFKCKQIYCDTQKTHGFLEVRVQGGDQAGFTKDQRTFRSEGYIHYFHYFDWNDGRPDSGSRNSLKPSCIFIMMMVLPMWISTETQASQQKCTEEKSKALNNK